MIYKRNCPECGSEIEYKNPRSFSWASRDGKPCRLCYSKVISKTLKNKVLSGEFAPYIRNSAIDNSKDKLFTKQCPECNEPMCYTTLKGLKKAINGKTICNRCASYKYNKTFKSVVKSEHILQMRASKAGFVSWDDYVENYPKKQFYKREVWRLTYKQPLTTLENWNLRGRCGKEGAYQLDHIQSINWGWENKIEPAEIAKFENLRMIPWKDNLLKSSK